MILKYIETLTLMIESMKKDLLNFCYLTWLEYHILCMVNQFEMKDINPTPEEVINVSGKNRGWIYKAIRKLSKEEAVL